MKTPMSLLAALALTLGWTLACAGGEGPPGDGEEEPEQPEEEPEEPEEPEDGLAGSGTKDDPFVLTCSTKAKELTSFEEEAWVTCPDGCASGSVWGTCTYTFDSSVCLAANHSGALQGPPYAGGLTKAVHAPGEESYEGSEQGEIRSSDWGSYDDSLTFARMKAAPCASGSPAPTPTPRPRARPRPRR